MIKVGYPSLKYQKFIEYFNILINRDIRNENGKVIKKVPLIRVPREKIVFDEEGRIKKIVYVISEIELEV